MIYQIKFIEPGTHWIEVEKIVFDETLKLFKGSLETRILYTQEERDALVAIIKRSNDALSELDEAYCRSGEHLRYAERQEDRKRLIEAREAVKAAAPLLIDTKEVKE